MVISAIGNVDAAADRLSCHGLGPGLGVFVARSRALQIFSAKKWGRKKAR